RIVTFAPTIVSWPILTSPIRYSSTRYSWVNITVLYPIILFLPIWIRSGYMRSGMARNARDTLSPSFMPSAFLYSTCLTFVEGAYRPSSMNMKLLITLIIDMLLLLFHRGLTSPALLLARVLLAIPLCYGVHSFRDAASGFQSDRRAFCPRVRRQLRQVPRRIRHLHCGISADRISSPAS